MSELVTEPRASSTMRLPCCFKSVKGAVNLFFSLSWMAFLIYFILMKLISDDGTIPKHVYRSASLESKYAVLLAQLGFQDVPRLYPQAYQHIDEKEWPIFVLPLRPDDIDTFFIDFLISFRTFFLDHRLVIYNLGFTSKQKDFVQARCYCQVRSVMWSAYPKHVSHLKAEAYVPLLLQETLMEFGSVFWCDVKMRFLNKDLKPDLSTQAQLYGVTAWSRDHYPTSTYTHHGTFRYFNVSSEEFYFHKMVHPTPALYYNTKALHDMMLQWIKCVLDEHCVSPSGAQASWCNRTLRPKYLYAGCHKYSTSAFNIILLQTHGLEAPYRNEKQLFYMVKDSKSSVIETFSNITAKFIKIS